MKILEFISRKKAPSLREIDERELLLAKHAIEQSATEIGASPSRFGAAFDRDGKFLHVCPKT